MYSCSRVAKRTCHSLLFLFLSLLKTTLPMILNNALISKKIRFSSDEHLCDVFVSVEPVLTYRIIYINSVGTWELSPVTSHCWYLLLLIIQFPSLRCPWKAINLRRQDSPMSCFLFWPLLSVDRNRQMLRSEPILCHCCCAFVNRTLH